MRKTTVLALLCFTLYLFHIVRNLTPFYLIALALSLAAFVFAFGAQRNHNKAIFDVSIIFFAFAWVFASFVTFSTNINYVEPTVGLIRFWASFPLALICLVLASNTTKRPLQILTIFFVLAALSLPLQYVVGPITWFAEASERAGGSRYASLAGSLTAYGIALGVPILASFYYYKKINGLLIFIILAIGAALSLQKAALANIVIAIIFAWWLKLVDLKTILISLPMFFVSSAIFTYIVGFNSDQFEAAFRYLEGILTSQSDLSNDVFFLDSLVDRLTALPLEALKYFGTDELLLGAGVFGGAGAMGFEIIPTAHNGFVELILIFGYFVGGAIILFLLNLLVKAILVLMNRSSAANTEIGFLSSCYIIWLVNYIFSGGALFHPIGAATFWLLLFRIRFIVRTSHVPK
jgi:hypothetical protein